MIIRIPKRTERIRAVVFFFSVFVALMLFQTSYMRLGTLTAAAAILLTIAAFFLQNGTLQGKLLLPFSAICLLFFLLYSVLRTMIAGYTPSSFVPYISQIVLCIILYSVSLKEREVGKILPKDTGDFIHKFVELYAERFRLGQILSKEDSSKFIILYLEI